jgi:hypothetical protein
MRTLRAVVVLAVAGLVTAGCLTLRSYVDPQLPKVGYDNLLARSNPTPLALTVAFHRNGEPAPRGEPVAKSSVRTVIEKSKLFSSVSEQPAAGVDRLDVVLDNIADRGDAAGKGALTGLTFGAKGSHVTDGYVFTATFRPATKDPITKVYRHAIHSTIGNADAPAGLTPEPSLRAAFDKVVEGLVLNLLLDLQKEERL